MATAEMIARVLGLRRAGREFTGKCPSCGYVSGFAMRQRNGAILVHCHAGGCSQEELWAALERIGFARQDRSKAPRGQPARSRETRVETVAAWSAPIKGADQTDSQAAALAIWRRSRSARRTPVETYLREARNIAGPIPTVLRFAIGRHPSDLDQWHPMMVAAVICAGRFVAVHRTFVSPDGLGKANLDPVKMTLGPCKGAAVPLAPAGPRLGVTEGIENGLSYLEATGIPTWSALSAGGIPNLVLPDVVQEVVIALDPDPVGIMAAHAAARRWLREGRRVSIARPPLGFDFNDLARA